MEAVRVGYDGVVERDGGEEVCCHLTFCERLLYQGTRLNPDYFIQPRVFFLYLSVLPIPF